MKQSVVIPGLNAPKIGQKVSNMTNAQWEREKQAQLEAFNEKKKMQDHFTQALEEVVARLDAEGEEIKKW